MGARTRTLNEFGTRPATRADKPTRHSISRLAKNQKRDAPLKESSRDGSGLLLIRGFVRKKKGLGLLPSLPLTTGPFSSPSPSAICSSSAIPQRLPVVRCFVVLSSRALLCRSRATQLTEAL